MPVLGICVALYEDMSNLASNCFKLDYMLLYLLTRKQSVIMLAGISMRKQAYIPHVSVLCF